MKKLALSLLAVASVAANAQIQPIEAQLYGYTGYNSGSWYGFPGSIGFSDSHSGFIYATVGGGTEEWPVRFDNFFGPTDESPDGNIQGQVRFHLGADSIIRIRYDSYGAINTNWYMRDQDYNVVASGDLYPNTFEFYLPAGTYHYENNSVYSFWWGGSYATSELHLSAVTTRCSATAASIIQGTGINDDFGALTASDDYWFSLLSDETSLQGEVEILGVANIAVPVSLKVRAEGYAERLGLATSIRLYNYQTSAFENVFGGVAAGQDAVTDVVISSSPARFVGPSNALKARVTWEPINDEDPAQDGWGLHLDEFAWFTDRP